MNEPIRIEKDPIRTTIYVDGNQHRLLVAHLQGMGMSYSQWVQKMESNQLYQISKKHTESYERSNTNGITN